jgi:hypothetical protein
MKKIYLLGLSVLSIGSLESRAQDTLVYESFNFQLFYDDMQVAFPSGTTGDALWYNFDGDGLADGSATGDRPAEWFAVQAFSDVDTTDNVVIGANSWFTGPAAADNWLITPSLTLRAHDTLFWKSAPSQTPRYLDGYKVRLSTTDNDIASFTTTLFTAAEMTNLPAGEDTVFSNFTFAPSGAFVHGQDGTYIDVVDMSAAHWLHNGQLRPFSVPLDAYAGQSVYIAFHHDSFDDNLISIDDFMIRGTNNAIGIIEKSNELGLNVFPNPAVDVAQVNYNLSSSSTVSISIFDVTGKLIATENKGVQAAGRHFSAINTSAMANGFYTVSVQTENAVSVTKMIVK